jgi:hypothetical protein
MCGKKSTIATRPGCGFKIVVVMMVVVMMVVVMVVVMVW